jgi:DNA-binding PadR family transcriptional regulator
MPADLSEFLPLSPAALHILMALAGEDRHGYGIMQEIARQSGGAYKLGPGTLYDNLQRLLEQGIVEEAATRAKDDDPRRKYYRLNPFGSGLLSAEIGRLEGLFRKAKTQLRKAALS